MPRFSDCCENADMYLCQVCGKDKCSGCQDSVWRPDITGHEGAGNVCPSCLSDYNRSKGVYEVQN